MQPRFKKITSEYPLMKDRSRMKTRELSQKNTLTIPRLESKFNLSTGKFSKLQMNFQNIGKPLPLP